MTSKNLFLCAKTPKPKTCLAITLIMLSPIVFMDMSYAAGRVFYDGFEAHATNSSLGSPWATGDGYGVSGPCQVRTTSYDSLAGAYAGSKMLSCNWDGSGSDSSGGSATYQGNRLFDRWTYNSEILFRWRFRVDTDLACSNCPTNPGGGPKFMRPGSTSSAACSFFGVKANSDGLMGGFCNKSGTYLTPTTYWGGDRASDRSWHEIAIYIKRGSGTSGIGRLFIDRVQVFNATGDTVSGWDYINQFNLSSNWSGGAGCCGHDANNHVYWDEFEVYTDTGTGGTGTLSDDTITQGGSGGTTVLPSPPTNLRVQ